MKILQTALIFFFLVSLSINSQELENDSFFSLGLAPGLSIPLAEDGEIFSIGAGADISAYLRFGLLSNLDLNLIAGDSWMSSKTMPSR